MKLQRYAPYIPMSFGLVFVDTGLLECITFPLSFGLVLADPGLL
jgi:hypothetical protein